MGDINSELINFYRVLRRSPHRLLAAVNALRPGKTRYYEMRSGVPKTSLTRAVRFYYLIRLSWNGLYRVNRQGHFNVPYGYRRPTLLLRHEIALAAAQVLRRTTIRRGDFEDITAPARCGDLVYFDPPYPKGAINGNGFSRYHETGFDLDDHRRLATHAAKLAARGVNVLITEAARKEILQRYSSSFAVNLVRNHSLIAADTDFRRDVYEAILTSYPLR